MASLLLKFQSLYLFAETTELAKHTLLSPTQALLNVFRPFGDKSLASFFFLTPTPPPPPPRRLGPKRAGGGEVIFSLVFSFCRV